MQTAPTAGIRDSLSWRNFGFGLAGLRKRGACARTFLVAVERESRLGAARTTSVPGEESEVLRSFWEEARFGGVHGTSGQWAARESGQGRCAGLRSVGRHHTSSAALSLLVVDGPRPSFPTAKNCTASQRGASCLVHVAAISLTLC